MQILNFDSKNPNIEEKRYGPFTVVERIHDMSPNLANAANEYYFGKLGGRTRQLKCDAANGIILQKGAMQAICGDVKSATNVKGVGDFLGKALRGKVTGESTINPKYTGPGVVISEPTQKWLLAFNVEMFGGGMVLEDGIFYACEGFLNQRVVSRNSISSAVAGNEGMFNLAVEGRSGIVIIESPVAEEDLIFVRLENETLKLDGSMAIAWSESLNFTVARSSQSLLGSAMNGEGLVNQYSGTGMVVYKALSTH